MLETPVDSKPIYYPEQEAYKEACALSEKVHYAIYVNCNNRGFYPSCFAEYSGQCYYYKGRFILPQTDMENGD